MKKYLKITFIFLVIFSIFVKSSFASDLGKLIDDSKKPTKKIIEITGIRSESLPLDCFLNIQDQNNEINQKKIFKLKDIKKINDDMKSGEYNSCNSRFFIGPEK